MGISCLKLNIAVLDFEFRDRSVGVMEAVVMKGGGWGMNRDARPIMAFVRAVVSISKLQSIHFPTRLSSC